MIFIRRESFRQYLRLYPVTSLLLGLNIVMFIVLSFSGGSQNLFNLIQFGAIIKYPGQAVEYWRYFTSIFLHIGFDHLLFNGIALFLFAPPLERMLGRLKYGALYIGSGLAGNVLSVPFLSAVTVSAGASGAIYGVFGGLIYMSRHRRWMIDAQSRKMLYIILIIGVIHSLINPAINTLAHLGGFIGGYLLFSLFHKVR